MVKWTKIVMVFVSCSLISLSLAAQNKNQLKSKKKKLHQEISTMNVLLDEIGINKKQSEIAYIINLKKIGAREELISSINQEIQELNQEIEQQYYAIDSLNEQLKNYREQYKKMLLYAYKNRNSTNELIFIFSSQDFNQAYKRLKYLKRIGEYRKYQAIEVALVQKSINGKIALLQEKKAVKNKFLGNKHYEKKKLQVEKSENQSVLQSLKKDEKKLKKKILAKQKEANQLDEQIKKIIEKEIAEARERARKQREKLKKKGGKNDPFDLTPVASKLSKKFELNKGKLPWPVKSGTISGKYGVGTHPVFKHLKVINNGINLITNKGTNALAIFGGNVVAIIVLPAGGKSAVLVQHGAYFTMYSNLITVKVEKGQKVKLGQKLGVIKTDEEGKTEIHFELWKGNEKQNPALWLKK